MSAGVRCAADTADTQGEEIVDETFGQCLRRLRGSRSFRDVASVAACSKSYLSDLERGLKTPTPQMVAALDQALEPAAS